MGQTILSVFKGRFSGLSTGLSHGRTIYSEINPHITWHTNNSAPVITNSIETQLYRWLRGRILQAPGVLLHAIGGTGGHVHLAVTVPPTLLVTEYIGE